MFASLAATAAGATAGSMTVRDARGTTLRDSNLNFTLDLPAGFVHAPEVQQRIPGIAHAYGYGRRDSNGVSITLAIKRLGRTLERTERLRHSEFTEGMTGRLTVTEWNGFVLNCAVGEKKYGHRTYHTHHVRIPLKREAIAIELFGPVTRKDELDTLFRQVLDGLSGESNWSADDATAPTAAAATPGELFGVSPRKVMIGAAIVGAIGFVPLFWPRRTRRAGEMTTGTIASSWSSPSSSSSSSSSPPPLPPIGGATPPPLPTRPPPF